MARNLNEKDQTILKKLAPESEIICHQTQNCYWSILPPLSLHYSTSSQDFYDRFMRLSDDELNYLINLIFDGLESLHCVKKEHIDMFLDVVEIRISKKKAMDLLELYETFLSQSQKIEILKKQK